MPLLRKVAILIGGLTFTVLVTKKSNSLTKNGVPKLFGSPDA